MRLRGARRIQSRRRSPGWRFGRRDSRGQGSSCWGGDRSLVGARRICLVGGGGGGFRIICCRGGSARMVEG